jgi:hypothetical protein
MCLIAQKAYTTDIKADIVAFRGRRDGPREHHTRSEYVIDTSVLGTIVDSLRAGPYQGCRGRMRREQAAMGYVPECVLFPGTMWP